MCSRLGASGDARILAACALLSSRLEGRVQVLAKASGGGGSQLLRVHQSVPSLICRKALYVKIPHHARSVAAGLCQAGQDPEAGLRGGPGHRG